MTENTTHTTQTYSISILLDAHSEGRVILVDNAPTEHETAEDWYDSYGAHVSTEHHGDICIQFVEYGWLDDDDAAVTARVLEGLADPQDDEDLADLQSVAEELIDRARHIRTAADSIESLLDDVVTAYETGDVDATVEALREASSAECDHGDDPATQTLIRSLCAITDDEVE